ncbi:hypothetical protein LPTSP4_02460 [Leptospira ryugenii]|uniref:Uncharacterized protein n=1 Tax=Leptospira ryugenii TaxID=1917863 RepID=A0A2P2DVT6_9LEPT|nr:hypothetical protein [Leptospira ryugenii]GBF48746.1 hypothetical protein LPTSP4_02460 [Leptospira ryugenii]
MQIIFNTLIFSVLFFFLWDVEYSMVPSIRETWVWNKEGAFGTASPKLGEVPTQTLNGYKIGDKFYSFSLGKSSQYTDPNFVDFALLGKGYIEYQKIGDSVNFFSEKGELFWNKDINSYPRSGYFASPVLYLSGDNNTVFLMDVSGNKLGKGALHGRFLTDYDFDKKGNGAIVLFSGGELYRVDEKGNTLFEKDLSSEKPGAFFKSISLSPNGKLALIHFSLNQKDFFGLLDETGELEEEWEIQNVYTHKLYFAINDKAKLLVNFPDKLSFQEKETLLWEIPKQKKGGVYQVSFVYAGGFVYNLENEIVFLDENGIELNRKSIPLDETPIRLFPGKAENVFYLETKKDIYQFRYFP